jgi:hypothetical protein
MINRDELFNSPFELGIRMVILLLAMYPRKTDLQRLVYLDYAAIYSADLGGPPSLHTPVPLRGTEYLSRRHVIEEGLYRMATHDLIEVSATSDGIEYLAGEGAASFVALIGSKYSLKLFERCKWAAEYTGSLSISQFQELFRTHGTVWGAEFIGNQDQGEN